MEPISKNSELNTVGELFFLVIIAPLSLVSAIVLIDMATLSTIKISKLISSSVPLGFHSPL